MAQPHPSHSLRLKTRPCWQCGTQHKSGSMPALCSDSCRDAWRQRYAIAFGVPAAEDSSAPRHTNHDCNPEPLIDFSAFGTTVAEAFAGVPGMGAIARAAMDAEERQTIAEAHNVDEPQDLVGAEQAATQLLPLGMPEGAELLGKPQEPDEEPWYVALQPKPRQSWWRRLLRRSS